MKVMSTTLSSSATEATPIYTREETRGDPGHTGETTSLGWASEHLRILEEVSGEGGGGVWAFLMFMLPP